MTRYYKHLCTQLLLQLVILLLHGTSLCPATVVPILPGAEGFGVETPAGRGGTVLKVVTLADSGPGSLRAAIETKGPRIVVFDVSGTIMLNTPLIIRLPYITIAGQSAPSPGITLRGAGISVRTHDVLIQHLRIRVGDDPAGPDPSNRDGIQILSPSNKVIIDHLSASWAIDENGSTWGVSDITIANSIFSEGLNRSLHRKGSHSKGFLIGDGSRRIAFIGNLLAHNVDRQPLIKAGSSAMLLNNLVYNPGGNGYVRIGIDDEGSGPAYLSAVGNVFIKGPDTPKGRTTYCFEAGTKSAAGTKFYLNDNLHVEGPVWRGPAEMHVQIRPADTWTTAATVRASGSVESLVLTNAGARPGDRDAVDNRIVGEVRTRGGRIIDSQSQVGGWPVQSTQVTPFLTPENPQGDDDGDGYTNIEEVLHQLSENLTKAKGD